MENDKGLDLSLGLLCGGATDSLKNNSGSASEEVVSGRELINDFKSFLEGGAVKHDSSSWTQRNDPVKTEENFFNDLSKAPLDAETSKSLHRDGFILGNYIKYSEVEEKKRLDGGEKRKSLFNEVSQQKKLEREAHRGDLHNNNTAIEGSTAENEDVADSDSTKKEFKFMPTGVQCPMQSANNVNMSNSLPVKDTHTNGPSSTSSYQLPGMMHLMATRNSEPLGSQQVMPANFPLMFGYSSQQQQSIPCYAGRGEVSSDKHGDLLKIAQASAPFISLKSSALTQFDGRALEHVKVDGIHNIKVESSSSHIDNDVKKGNTIFRSTPSEQLRIDGVPSNYPATRPGLAADLKFGGCGSSPNLPWVSTTGPGPNGKTISGVTYRHSPNQLRIVCACHGSHMSPEEFVRHSCEEQTNPDGGASVASSLNTNPEASAQS